MIGLEMVEPVRDKIYQMISIAEKGDRKAVNKFLENLTEKEVRLLKALMSIGKDETGESLEKKGADNIFAYYFTTSGMKNDAVFQLVKQTDNLAGYLRSSIEILGLYQGAQV